MRHRSTIQSFWAVLFAFLGIAAVGVVVRAHEIRPTVVTLDLAADRYIASVSLNLEALLAGIGPEHQDSNAAPEAAAYRGFRALEAADLEAAFQSRATAWLGRLQLTVDGVRIQPSISKLVVPPRGDESLARVSTILAEGPLPAGAALLVWRADWVGPSIVRVKRPGQDLEEIGWIAPGQSSRAIALSAPAAGGTLRTFADYVVVGFTHILPKGIDHILFVLGLYFLAAGWRPLLVQVTAFTLAHSVTLALGLYEVVSLSPSIVEPLIALSIVYVAVENLLTNRMQRWRPLVVFAFGLLHGLGFASVLQDVGLPDGQRALALAGFNVGVELGQLAVIGLAFLTTGYWFRDKVWYRQRIVWPACAAIALVGAFWTVERVWFV